MNIVWQKHRIWLLSILLLFIALVTTCRTQALADLGGADSNSTGASVRKKLSIHDFEFIKEEQPFEEVRKVLGEPGNDIGSGIHIYVYDLTDGTIARVGCVDKVIFLDHVIDGKATRLVGKK